MPDVTTSNLRTINDLQRHIEPMRRELEQVASRVFDSAWFILGEQVQAFEREFAAYCGLPHCVGVANGTEALELGLKALGIGRGQRVATVANAGMYSTVAILSAGATPVFVDVDPVTLLIDPRALQLAIAEQRPHAVVVTHLYGRLADIKSIIDLCVPLGVPVIEDCAQAHGATRDGRKAGSFGAIGCFSFYPTKNLGALGDGGAIVTRSETIAAKLRNLRQYGWTRKYHATVRDGRNSRLDELQAAFLRVALPRLDGWNARRRTIAARYVATIRHPDVACPPLDGDAYVAHLFVVRCRRRDALASRLASFDIPCDVHFPVADYRQPAVADLVAAGGALPVTDAACDEVLTLPCFPEMTDDEVSAVADCVNGWQA